MLRRRKITNYAKFNLFLLLSVLFWADSHIDFFFNALAARFSWRLFLFTISIKSAVRNVVFLPVKLIKEAHQQDWLKSLAYFVRLKSLYVNNTHYNFNLRNLSKKLNCSTACLSHHLKVLIRRGLVVEHSGNMSFRGLHKISALYPSKAIGVPVDHKNQLNAVRAQIIRFNLATQEYNIKKTGVQKCPGTVPNNFSERFYSCYAGLSAAGFGKVLGLSTSQGAAIRASMIQTGLLTAKRRYSLLRASGGPSGGGLPDRALQAALIQMKRQGLMPAYAFAKDGCIWTERRMELGYARA